MLYYLSITIYSQLLVRQFQERCWIISLEQRLQLIYARQ